MSNKPYVKSCKAVEVSNFMYIERNMSILNYLHLFLINLNPLRANDKAQNTTMIVRNFFKLRINLLQVLLFIVARYRYVIKINHYKIPNEWF